VLFLFVVMMLDVDYTALRQGFLDYLPVGAVVGIVFFVELLMMLIVGTGGFGTGPAKAITEPIPPMADVTNTEALGQVLYTKYVYYFEAAGLILLVAMIGAIVLTLRHKPNVKRQNIADQVARTKATAIKIRKVQPGQGI
jgi:NADH-quinone oxidoreductase subunit J